MSRYGIMPPRASLAAAVAACACASGASAGGPGAVYNDYVQDGVLSCNHSRADLVAVLRSGSLNQYGDPLTLARLKLAVRKQLAGGCRHSSTSSRSGSRGTGAPSGGGRTDGGQPPQTSKGAPAHATRSHGSKPDASAQAVPNQPSSSGGSNASFVAGRGLIVGLLIAALAFAGWLTKHALAARD